MITIKEGSLFDATEGVICHQVNCKGNMGRGIAKQFQTLFPAAFDEYVRTCHSVAPSSFLLGKIVVCRETINPILYTCSMFAQDDWRGHNVCNTNYPAFRECCGRIKQFQIDNSYSLVIHMPYLIGCGLGGGDWPIVYSIIEEELCDYNVILWKLKN